MAITWSRNGGLEIGVEWLMSPGSVSASTSSVTLTWKVWLRNVGRAYIGNWNLSVSGAASWSGSVGINMPNWNQQYTVLLREGSFSVAPSFDGVRNYSLTATYGPASGYGTDGARPSATGGVTVPRRPYTAPATPTGATATRSTDTSITITWAESTGAGAPVSGFYVDRRSLKDSTWRNIAQPGGSARSYTDTSVSAGDRYEYRVGAFGPGGHNNQHSYATAVATTPPAPTGVDAVKQADGSILVTWGVPTPFYGDSFSVYDNGVRVASGVSSSARQWRHSAPSTSVTHTYTLTQTASGLESAKSSPSGTVQLLTRPNPPTLTSPSGSVLAGSTQLTWQHNPVDTTAQTRAEVRCRKGSGSWSTLTVTGSSQQTTINTVAGSTYEWQVRTQGAYLQGQTGGWSDWSPVGSFRAVAAPTVVINAPGSTVTTSRVTVEWGYSQAQGAAQTSATVELCDVKLVGTPETGMVFVLQPVETKTVQGTASSLTLATTVKDGKRYGVRVTVRSSDGLTSSPAEAIFMVDYPEPPDPVLDVTWDDTLGTALVAINNRAATEGEADTDHNTVYRSIDGGQTWEQVADNVPPNTVVSDAEALSMGTTLYRADATSTLPSSATSETVEVTANSQSVYLHAGDGTQVARLAHQLTVTESSALRFETDHYFQGRRLPVTFDGEAIQRQYQVTAITFPAGGVGSTDDIISALQAIATTTGRKIMRTPTGGRVYGRVRGMSTTREVNGMGRISFTFTETDEQ